MDTTKRSMWWSITINNPTADDEEALALARQAGWKIEGQLEKGAEGTPHYQLAVKSPGQVRFSAVKKLFARAHIEAARQPKALRLYAGKEETRIGELPTSQEMYPSLSKFWELIAFELDALNPYIVGTWFGAEEWDERKGEGPLPSAVEALKKATSRLIEKGYHVESLASNPAVKSAWKDFHVALCRRSYDERRKREERDALDSAESVSVDTVNADEEAHVNIPQTPVPLPPPVRRTVKAFLPDE